MIQYKVLIKIVLKCQMCREMDYRTPCLYLIMDINFHSEIETELILKRRINEGAAVVAVTISYFGVIFALDLNLLSQKDKNIFQFVVRNLGTLFDRTFPIRGEWFIFHLWVA